MRLLLSLVLTQLSLICGLSASSNIPITRAVGIKPRAALSFQRTASPLLTEADSGGGDDIKPPSDGGGGGGGDDEPEWMPDDMADALAAGRIGDAEMANWDAVLSNPIAKALAASAYIRCRLLAEPRLPNILAIEIAVGCLATLAAEKAARGEKFFKELDFVLANQVLIVLTNIALVLALTPAAAIAAPPAAGTLAAAQAALPGFFLQAGDFSVSQRAVCFVSKAVQFSAVGSITSACGQAVTKGLVAVRTKLEPDVQSEVELAPVLETAGAYAVFMGVSSNTRYQIVNSLEAYGLPAVPPALRVPTSFIVRTFNNYLGSSNWIWWAKFRGLQ